jgi:hypothetical protein
MAKQAEEKTGTPPETSRGTSPRTPFAPRFFRVARATLAAAAVTTCFGFIALRTSYASASDAAMNFGDELLHLGERNPSGELTESIYHLNINGQRAETANGFTRHSMGEVLDYFKAQCDQHAEGLVDVFADLDSNLVDMQPVHGAPGYATIRGDKPSQGFVFCASTDHELTKQEKLGRFRKLTTTGDLGSLGAIRYVAVQKVEGGSHVVAAWTHGSFNLYAMFPREGDSPGLDFPAAPRPDDSRRIFAGLIDGASYGANIYEVKGEPDAVFAGVDAKLKAAGWKATPIYRRIPKVGYAYSLGDKLDLLITVNKATREDSSVTYLVSETIGTVAR